MKSNHLLHLLLLLICMLLSSSVFADSQLSGIVTASDSHGGLPGVTVRVVNLADTSKILGAYSNAQGRFVLRSLAPGKYRVTFSYIGYGRIVNDAVVIGSEPVTLSVMLTAERLSLNNVVVSATRQPEKVIDAPASVSIVNATQIAEVPAFTPTEHLRGVAGIDVAQQGLLAASIVARGFNTVFNHEMMMLTDNRLASLPALQANIPYYMPQNDADIERMEIVRGPGSALYGPNAASGVLNIITKSPFSSQGTTVSVGGGDRSVFDASLRHAGTIGDRFGYKISGQYFRGFEWPQPTDTNETNARAKALAAGALADTLLIGVRHPLVQRYSVEGRMDVLLGDNMEANVTAGLSEDVNSITQTDLGASEGQNFRTTFLQGRFSAGALFVQSYINQNNAGQSYQLTTGNLLVDRSTQWVTQAQHSTDIGDRERLTYGLDMLLTHPITDGTIYGVYEGNNINEYGAYLQSRSLLIDNPSFGRLDAVISGRVDKNSRIDNLIYSPRAALEYSPFDNNVFRATFNRAYSAPGAPELFLDIVANPNVFGLPAPYAVELRGQGTLDGFSFTPGPLGYEFHSTFANPNVAMPVDSAEWLWPAVVALLKAEGKDISKIPAPTAGQVKSFMALLDVGTKKFNPVAAPTDIAKFEPTVTETFELGYKGIVDNRWELGVDVYHSNVTNFRSPLMVVTPNVFLSGASVTAYVKPYIKAGLLAAGLSDSAAEQQAQVQSAQIGAGVGQVPLGTVEPNQAVTPAAVILASRNYGSVSVYGVDVSAMYSINESWSVGGNYSYISQNFFANLDGVSDLALNAPKHKGTVTLRYKNVPENFTVDLMYRHSDGFQMSSGVYAGTVTPYNLLDASVQIGVPGVQGMMFTVSATNLFNDVHEEFAGSPYIGRLLMAHVRYSL